MVWGILCICGSYFVCGVIVCLDFGWVHVFVFISCFCWLVIVGVLEKFENRITCRRQCFLWDSCGCFKQQLKLDPVQFRQLQVWELGRNPVLGAARLSPNQLRDQHSDLI